MIDGIGAGSTMANRPTPATTPPGGGSQGAQAGSNAAQGAPGANPAQATTAPTGPAQATAQPVGGSPSLGTTQSVNPSQGTTQTVQAGPEQGASEPEPESAEATQSDDMSETLSADGSLDGGANVGSQLNLMA